MNSLAPVGNGLVGTVVEHSGADAFGLAQAVDAFHQGVVIGITDGPMDGWICWRARVSVKWMAVYCLGSRGRCNTGLWDRA